MGLGSLSAFCIHLLRGSCLNIYAFMAFWYRFISFSLHSRLRLNLLKKIRA